MDENEIPHTTE